MNDLSPSRASSGFAWRQEAGRRLRTLGLAKAAGVSAGMTGFFAAYFWLLQHPARPPLIMPLTFVDHRIPFQPGALPFYLSLWLYVSLAPGLAATGRELVRYGFAATALALTGLLLFRLWPTAVPPPGETWAADSAFAFLKNTDAAGNACPSLHVAFAVFTALVLARTLREVGAGRTAQALNVLWCLAIVYSTLATRQHVFLDALAGAALGTAFGLIRPRAH